MADFVTLTCPSCGGKLQLTSDVERFACGYCGTEHIVRRGGGIVSLAPVLEGLSRVQAATDKAASELAIKRLEPEIAKLEGEYRQLQNQIDKTESGCSPMSIAITLAIVSGLGSIIMFVMTGKDAFWSALLVGTVSSAIFIGMGIVFSRGSGKYKGKLIRKQDELAKVLNRKRSELKKHLEIVNL